MTSPTASAPGELIGLVESVLSLYRFDTVDDRARASEAIRLFLERLTAQPSDIEICPDCNGAGGDNQHTICGTCNGSGGVPKAQPSGELIERVARAVQGYEVLADSELLCVPIGLLREIALLAAMSKSVDR